MKIVYALCVAAAFCVAVAVYTPALKELTGNTNLKCFFQAMVLQLANFALCFMLAGGYELIGKIIGPGTPLPPPEMRTVILILMLGILPVGCVFLSQLILRNRTKSAFKVLLEGNLKVAAFFLVIVLLVSAL